jgi:hypothetical protein
MKETLFLEALQKEARLQSQIKETEFLPAWLSSLARFVGSHSLFCLILLSFFLTLIAYGTVR